MQVQFLSGEYPLEEGTATHSSILAWRIQRTEELGGLQSIGSQSWTRLKRLSSSSSSICQLWASQLAEVVKNVPANAGDMGSITGLGRSSEGGHGNPLQYSCLDNPLDRETWRATVHRVAELDMTKAT